jgi:hypothetical protein
MIDPTKPRRITVRDQTRTASGPAIARAIVSVTLLQNAPKSPVLPHSNAKMQNEATALQRCIESLENVAKCRGSSHPNPKTQNEPTAPRTDAKPSSDHRLHQDGDPDPALSPRQLSAINMLFDGATFMQVCNRLLIDRKTLYRWRTSALWVAEVRRRYREHTPARKPRSQSRDPLIPNVKRLSRHVDRADPVDPDDPYATLNINGGPLPPQRDDEPFWLKEIRRSREAFAARQRERGEG